MVNRYENLSARADLSKVISRRHLGRLPVKTEHAPKPDLRRKFDMNPEIGGLYGPPFSLRLEFLLITTNAITLNSVFEMASESAAFSSQVKLTSRLDAIESFTWEGRESDIATIAAHLNQPWRDAESIYLGAVFDVYLSPAPSLKTQRYVVAKENMTLTAISRFHSGESAFRLHVRPRAIPVPARMITREVR